MAQPANNREQSEVIMARKSATMIQKKPGNFSHTLDCQPQLPVTKVNVKNRHTYTSARTHAHPLTSAGDINVCGSIKLHSNKVPQNTVKRIQCNGFTILILYPCIVYLLIFRPNDSNHFNHFKSVHRIFPSTYYTLCALYVAFRPKCRAVLLMYINNSGKFDFLFSLSPGLWHSQATFRFRIYYSVIVHCFNEMFAKQIQCYILWFQQLFSLFQRSFFDGMRKDVYFIRNKSISNIHFFVGLDSSRLCVYFFEKRSKIVK